MNDVMEETKPDYTVPLLGWITSSDPVQPPEITHCPRINLGLLQLAVYPKCPLSPEGTWRRITALH